MSSAKPPPIRRGFCSEGISDTPGVGRNPEDSVQDVQSSLLMMSQIAIPRTVTMARRANIPKPRRDSSSTTRCPTPCFVTALFCLVIDLSSVLDQGSASLLPTPVLSDELHGIVWLSSSHSTLMSLAGLKCRAYPQPISFKPHPNPRAVSPCPP
jgi:hypothetical protein